MPMFVGDVRGAAPLGGQPAGCPAAGNLSPRQRSVQKSGTCAQLRPVKNRADAAKAAAATSPAR